jgi:transglutaminase-like putative cysteine protease
MVRDNQRPARWLTFVLVALAYLACEIASDPEGNLTAFGIVFGIVLLVLLVLAIAGSFILPVPSEGKANPPRKVTAILVALLVLPLVAERALREWTGIGAAAELQLIYGLRNLGLALAAGSAWSTCRRLAGVVALFLALFATAMGDQPAIPYVLAALAVTGGIWLVVVYRAEPSMSRAALSAGQVVDRVRLRFPARELLVFGSLAVVTLGLVVAGPKPVIGSLGEFAPTSGGTGDQDPFARYGTNDGPEETRGENGNSVGMVESDSFIESQKDAILDMASDMYGPPHKPPKDQEKLIAAGFAQVKENHSKLPENCRPNRDFDTSRQGPKDARKGESRSARALFEVAGRTPLHVAAIAYDRYDPEKKRWLQSPAPPGCGVGEDLSGECWMYNLTRRPDADWYAADDRHELKVAELKDRLVPTPAHTSRFRIKRVDRPEYYISDYDGVLGLAGRSTTPPGVVVHTDCRTVDRATLPDDVFASGGFDRKYIEVASELAADFSAVAQAWAGDLPRGWPQIQAILTRLRDDFVLDAMAIAPENHDHPVAWFLFESRRGPDYLFATAAALLLRSLDYPTRVCLGYYASPEAYDAVSQHTPVRKEDLHVWPEVLLRDGHWLVVEPTPGYDVLPPKKPWRERVADSLSAFASWTGRNVVAIAGLAVLLFVLVGRRRAISDWLWTSAWRLEPKRTWQQAALGTVRLLERRSRLAGRSRPRSQTLADWAAGLRPVPERNHGISELVHLAEWAAYSAAETPPIPNADAVTVCRRAVAEWTRQRFRAAGTLIQGAV